MKDSKVYCLGDIHGNYKGLIQVLQSVSFDKQKDTLIFLGDLADRWPQPVECLEELMSIKNLISIKGNHDLFLYKWATNKIIDKRWIKQGGLETIEHFEKKEGADKLFVEYFNKSVYFHYDENLKYFFCHGGFNINKIITKQKRITFAINRTLYEKAKKYEHLSINLVAKYDESDSKQIDKIIIGHTPTKNHLPHFCGNLINLDTGSGNGGKLTLMDIYSKKYSQSEFSKKLYAK